MYQSENIIFVVQHKQKRKAFKDSIWKKNVTQQSSLFENISDIRNSYNEVVYQPVEQFMLSASTTSYKLFWPRTTCLQNVNHFNGSIFRKIFDLIFERFLSEKR